MMDDESNLFNPRNTGEIYFEIFGNISINQMSV